MKPTAFFVVLSLLSLLSGRAADVPGTTRPKLQIINGSSQPIDIFWIKSEAERVPNGSVAPGKDTIITTTLGHRFEIVGRHDMTTAAVTSEVLVQGFRFDPPGKDGVPAYYTQTVSAGGFPIVASAKVNPYALQEAAFLVNLMLAKRPDVRAAMIKSGARMCIMAHDEYTTDLPEWSHLTPKDYRDARARGMGGSETDPYCSVAEENVLGFAGDPYSAECILIHEFAHNIHLRGMLNVDPTFDTRLQATYDAAMRNGLWKGKYASVNRHEYFAEGVQSWFDNNRVNDHDHNHVNTRVLLIEYDPGLAAICREVFGDTELKYTKPATRLAGHLAGYDPAKAPAFVWPKRLKQARDEIRAKAQARDKSANGDSKPQTIGALRGDAAPVVRKPNIVFILADDLGYGDVRCYNTESKVPTPNIDRLAREGMRFTDAHSPSTVCTPSRYSLLTGRMAFRINYRGVFEGVGGPCLIAEDQLTLPRMLRKQGYTTALMGKWHVGLSFLDKEGQRITKGGVEGVKLIDYARAIPDAPIHRGFDRFFGTACCPATDFLYAFIDGDRIPVPPSGMLDKSKLPKHPYAFDNRAGLIAPDYDLEELDLIFLKKSQEFLEQHAKSQPEKPFFLLHSMNAVHLPSFASKQFQGNTKAGPHGDFIHQLDQIVGELMTTLERLGMAENTVVMLSSDNGPETTSVAHMRADFDHDGARPWRGMKRDQWEGGHRVPFIARWPAKIAAGSTSDQTVCLTDVMATCAAISGGVLPDKAAEDSFDLAPVLFGQDGGRSVREYTLHQTNSLALAIRRGPWKYLDHRGSGGNNYETPLLKPFALPDSTPSAPGQLYNLQDDPGETRNLYDKHPEIVKELKELLEKSRREGRSAPRREREAPAKTRR
jgi:arylsulfatase A